MAGDPERTRVAEAGLADPSAAPLVASYLARRASEAKHKDIALVGPPDHPLPRYLRRFGFQETASTDRSGGGMARIIDLGSPMRKLTDYVGQRAASGALSGWEGSVGLSTDVGDVTLRVSDGRAAAEDGATGDLRAAMPQDRLLQLLFGYRDAHTVALDSDVHMSKEAATVLDSMFPHDTPYMWWSDRF